MLSLAAVSLRGVQIMILSVGFLAGLYPDSTWHGAAQCLAQTSKQDVAFVLFSEVENKPFFFNFSYNDEM